MELKDVLGMIGIILAALGIIILYRYSLPPDVKRGSVIYLYTKAELKEINKKKAKQRRIHNTMKLIGLIISLFGLISQLFLLFLK